MEKISEILIIGRSVIPAVDRTHDSVVERTDLKDDSKWLTRCFVSTDNRRHLAYLVSCCQEDLLYPAVAVAVAVDLVRDRRTVTGFCFG